MAELTPAEQIAADKAALAAKNKALEGNFMDPQYDGVETLVQKTWLPSAQAGKVVGSVLAGMSGDPPVEQMVNIVRRAYFAHENRPVLTWTPSTEYRLGDRVQGPDKKVYDVIEPGTSGATFVVDPAIGTTVRFKLEDPQPASAKPTVAERVKQVFEPEPPPPSEK